MTATRLYLVHCDGAQCKFNEAADENGSMEVGFNATLQEYRGYLQRNGWIYKNKKDFCPDCAEKERRK